MKFAVIPVHRVLCLKQDSLDPLDVAQVFRLDGLNIIGDFHHAARSDQLIQVELVDPPRSVDKMIWSIDMCPAVSTKSQSRYVRGLTSRQPFGALDGRRRVTRVDRHRRTDCYCYVVYFH